VAKSKTMQAIVEIAGNLSPTLASSIEGATKQLDGLNLKAIAVGAAVGGIAIATTKAMVDAGKYLVDLGGKFDEVSDSIRIGTSESGDALEGLMTDFDNVYASVPTTMEDAGKAITDYNTHLDLTGKDLQDLSKQAIQVSSMLGDDLSGVIECSSKAIKIWNIDAEDMCGAMDYVFKASQSTGAGFTDLMTNVQSFAPQLQELGYSFEESIALIGQLDKAGVDAGGVLGAMKKSVGELAKQGVSAAEGLAYYSDQIMNAKDMTEATIIASEIFGSKAGSTMAAAIRNGTMSVAELTAELEKNHETISSAAEDTYDFSERLQVFKQKTEVAFRPLASTMFDTLNDLMPVVSDLMEGLIPIIGEMSDVLIPIIIDIVPALMPALQELIPVILDMASGLLKELIPPLVEIMVSIAPVIVEILNLLAPVLNTLISSIIPIIVKLIKKLLPPLMKIINTVLPVLQTLLDAIIPILDAVIMFLEPILDLFISLLDPIISLISAAIEPLIGVLSMLIQNILEPLGPIIEFIAGLFNGVLGTAIEMISVYIDTLIGVFSGLIDFITAVFAGDWAGAWEAIVGIFGTIFDGIKTLFKIPINFIIDGINMFLGGLNEIKIPDWVPGIGGMGIDIPVIPRLAAGGFTDGLSIAGEAGVEAVISFDPAYRAANIGYWEQAGKRLGVYDDDAIYTILNDNNSHFLDSLPRFKHGGFTDGLSIAGEAGMEAVISFDNAKREQNIGYWAAAGKLLGIDDFSLSEMTGGQTIIYYDFSGFTWSPQFMTGNTDDEDFMTKLKAHEAEFFDWLEDFVKTREEGRFCA